MDERDLLRRAADLALDFRGTLHERPVRPSATLGELRAALDVPLSDGGEDPSQVLEGLARDADRGLMGTAGPRFFGFVIGASHPVGIAADWLTSAWGQNAGLYASSPANAVAEEVAERWLVDLFGLPQGTSAGFTTGAQGANHIAVAAARHALLGREGWDVERRGLYGAPPLHVVLGEEAHVTVFSALQFLGLGRDRVHRVAADGQGRMRPDALADVLATLDGPTLVCAQAGNINTGAFDPLAAIAEVLAERGGSAWLHVDGAFGLWAATVPALAHHVAGLERADSWATDGHKWLNAPYDSGIVLVRDRTAHRGSMTKSASYLVQQEGAARDPFDYVLEFSRRARGFPVYALLRTLGRSGVRQLVERACAHARRFATRLGGEEGVTILNEVVLNQVLVRFGDDDAITTDVIRRVQEDGTCWLSGTSWHGMGAMRISISGWSTTEEDVERSADAILRCWAAARVERGASGP